RRRHGPHERRARRRRSSRDRRLLPGRRHDRRNHAVHPRREALRRPDRHPAERQPVDRRLAHPPRARPEPDRRLAGGLHDLEGRHCGRLRGRRAPGPLALHPGRREPRLGLRPPSGRAVLSVDSRVKILFIADVFGAPGRAAVEERLAGLKEELGAGFCIVNAENVADGAGVTPRLADRLLAAGADVLTLGNHVWRRREIVPYLDSCDRIVRPANLGTGSPGRGLAVVEAADGTPVAVVNLQGILFMTTPGTPFELLDDLVEQARAAAKIVVVDFHAEATSEKVAVARLLDGRATAVIGTHTHVQTSDARVQPGGTAAITDAGMTGPHDSVIGVEAELAIRRMRTGMPVRFRPAEGGVRLEGVVVDCDADGRATAIEPVRVEAG